MTNLATIERSELATQQDRQIFSAVEKYNALVRFVKLAMKPGIDYGTIPGTDGKPVLFKAGAEKVSTLFQFQLRNEPVEKIQDWSGAGHDGEPFFLFVYKATISDRAGNLICEYEASCNSWEKKYRYRDAKRKCPTCGSESILKSKERGKGFFCWNKPEKGYKGCGATFAENDPAIVDQEVGKVPNPDIFDQVHTIQAIAQKRAFVGAVRLASNSSEFFSEDLDQKEVIDTSDLIDATFVEAEEILVPTMVVQPVKKEPEVTNTDRLKLIRSYTGHTPQQAKTMAKHLFADFPAIDAEQPTSWNQQSFNLFRNALLLDMANRWFSPDDSQAILAGIVKDNPGISDEMLCQSFKAEVELLAKDKHADTPINVGGRSETVNGISVS